ncbi:MAG: peroxiredoxin [Candidatus Parvarchaeota archaeon]|nr:peroxiredoxin [Candidatus Parvarchaeota archaeon]
MDERPSCTINDLAPDFEADAYHNGDLTKVKLSAYKGKWVVLFFYPADFTFVCPTELEGFAKDYQKFKSKGAEVIAASVDTHYVHKAWVEFDKRLSNIAYPMIADRNGNISRSYGVLNEFTGNSRRGLFIIDPEGYIKYIVITPDEVGRSTEETYRVLMALQTGSLCPANWKEGEATLKK